MLNTNITGTEPEEKGWVELDRGEVVAYSLKFGDYVVTKYKDTLATGDTVKLKWGSKTEQFIVILNDPKAPAGTTMLLAVNNINTSTGYQGTNITSYSVRFTGVNSGRILTYTEVNTGGLAVSYKTSGEPYWLCSADYSPRVGAVGYDGYKYYIDYTTMDQGVRPVIYISTSDIQ